VKLIAAFSGGKDSTAMVLKMHQLGMRASMLFTPAGNEPGELFTHVDRIQALTGYPLVKLQAPTLIELIQHWNALPNHRQRWCTRQIKIQPAIAYLKANPGSTLCIGLRADEEEREGMYGDQCDYRYPLRELGWDEGRVLRFLDKCGIEVPRRTNCKLCYGQRIGEWFDLWQNDVDGWAEGEAIELQTGRTFRSPNRDTWPAAMRDLRVEFEGGRRPRGHVESELVQCRVCTL
jgi:hypothetical protein